MQHFVSAYTNQCIIDLMALSLANISLKTPNRDVIYISHDLRSHLVGLWQQWFTNWSQPLLSVLCFIYKWIMPLIKGGFGSYSFNIILNIICILYQVCNIKLRFTYISSRISAKICRFISYHNINYTRNFTTRYHKYLLSFSIRNCFNFVEWVLRNMT